MKGKNQTLTLEETLDLVKNIPLEKWKSGIESFCALEYQEGNLLLSINKGWTGPFEKDEIGILSLKINEYGNDLFSVGYRSSEILRVYNNLMEKRNVASLNKGLGVLRNLGFPDSRLKQILGESK